MPLFVFSQTTVCFGQCFCRGAQMIRKGQMRDDGRGLSAAQQFYLLAE
jgi:hypothetical protein